MVLPRPVLLRMRNVSDKKKCTENQNTYFMFSSLFSENCTGYTIMWKNMVQPDRSQMAIYDACALHAGLIRQEYIHSQYLILISL